MKITTVFSKASGTREAVKDQRNENAEEGALLRAERSGHRLEAETLAGCSPSATGVTRLEARGALTRPRSAKLYDARGRRPLQSRWNFLESLEKTKTHQGLAFLRTARQKLRALEGVGS